MADLGEQAGWGLQLIGDRSEARALAEFRKLRLIFRRFARPASPGAAQRGRRGSSWCRIRVAETNRARGQNLCARLARAGGKCVVQRN
jgi:hypothetical protein